jgi:putative peptidoglycan lipid II flippase
MGRLYSSTYYALHDTRTPLTFAVIRVALTSVLGYLFALPVPRLLGMDPHWGGAGLTISFGIAGWTEFFLLRRSLNRRIGETGLPLGLSAALWLSAGVAGGIAFVLNLSLGAVGPIPRGILVAGTFGVAYLASTIALNVPEGRALLARLPGQR